MSINFPKEEEATIERWRAINAFHRQVSSSTLCSVAQKLLGDARPSPLH